MSNDETKPEATEGCIIQHHIIQAQDVVQKCNLAEKPASSFAGRGEAAPNGPDEQAASTTKEDNE